MSEKRVRRIDASGGLRLPTTDAWGNMMVDAIVCKPGVYPYRQADGTIRREFKPAEEIFAPAHMESVRTAAVTDEHLPGRGAVTPSNAREHMKGHATDVRRLDTDEMMAPLKITDAELIGKLQRKEKRGVSLGLDCTIDHTPGVWNGQPYDVVQRGMITNQISVTGSPRIGAAEMRLDSEDAVMVDEPPREDEHMKTMQLNIGDSTVEVEAGAGAVVQARLAKLDSELASAREEAATATKERDEALAKLDTANDELEKKAKLTIDESDLPRLFAERQKLMEGAARLLEGDALKALDSASPMDIRREACKANGVDVADKSDDYITARFDGLVEIKRDSAGDELKNAMLGRVPLSPESGGQHVDPNEEIRKSLAAIDSRHKEAIGGLKRGA